jgi:mitogen-activated protein kinase kinase kinase
MGVDVLLDEKGDVKLCDFDAARLFTAERAKLDTVIGTPVYMAPEAIMNQGSVMGAEDVWSLGCLVWEILSGKRPWYHLDNEWAMIFSMNQHEPPIVLDVLQSNPDCNELLQACFHYDPASRPSAKQLLDMPWLAV